MKMALSRKNLWEKTPRWLKSTVGRGCALVSPAWLLGRKFREHRRLVAEAQWWPAARAREYQLTRLRAILTLAYDKSPFYRRRFDAVGFDPSGLMSLAELRQLPTIDKQVVMENLGDLCTRDVSGRDVDAGSTGGTSGTPLRLYLDANRSAVEYAYITRSWERAGYKLGMPIAVLRGRQVGVDRNGRRHEYDPILRCHYYSTFHMTDEYMNWYVDHMRTLGPYVLHAYPSAAQTLAKYILRTGRQAGVNMRAVLLHSENVHPDQIEDIESAFDVRAFSAYGHSEKLVLAVQCESRGHYHVWPTYGYCELLDADGNPVTTPGQAGEIVGTGFINTVMPLIRYRTGDWATYAGPACPACGREHMLLSEIKGRWPQGDLIAADGSVITTTALNLHDDTFRHLREYQFHQSTPGAVTLRVVPAGHLGQEEQGRIVARLNRRLQGQLVFDLELRPELMKTARGKQPRVIQAYRPSGRPSQRVPARL